MTEQFKILTPRLHVRARTGMYLGSTALEKVDQFVLGVWKSVIYVPAIFKMINEIIDNSIDEAVRTKFEYATKIEVTIDTDDYITVTDNGRGIPQDEIFDTQTNTTVLRPVAAWTKVNAGTSFEENNIFIQSFSFYLK